MVDTDRYLVYTPDDNIEPVKNILPPRFYRLRHVKIIENCFLHCSCGFAVRQKMPCRHMLYITKSFSIENFHPRWLKMFQYTFERPGYNHITALYRKVENDHATRNMEKEQTIFYSSMAEHEKNAICSNYPFAISDTTEEDKNNILTLEDIHRMNHIAIRGFPLSQQLSTHTLPNNYSDSMMTINFSQDTMDLIQNDENFIENLQKEQKLITLSGALTSDSTNSEVTLKIREIMNVTNHNTEMRNEFMCDIDELYRKYMLKRKHMEEESNNNGIRFGYTGKCNIKYDKRKGT